MCPAIVSGIVTVNPADQLLVTVPSNNPRCLCESWPSFFLVSKLAKSLMIDRHLPICRCQKTNVSTYTVQEVVMSLTSDNAFFLGGQGEGGGREAKSKTFFNCVITMHQQILFKYSLGHRYFGN